MLYKSFYIDGKNKQMILFMKSKMNNDCDFLKIKPIVNFVIQ